MSDQIIVLDEQKMLPKILDLPSQLEKAWTTYWIKEIPLPQDFNRVLICGMGGSGIAGELSAELFASSNTPITSWHDYNLPAWADEKTFVIAVSYSGDTEETVSSVKTALDKKLPIVLITGGGKLEELAQIHALPKVKIDYESTPRAAVGWLYGALLTVLAKTKKFSFQEGDLFRVIEELRSTISKKSLLPKAEELAMALNNKVPLIVAASPLQAVARRFATQFNENSKTFAVAAPLPELCHNLINGLDYAVPEKLTVIMLESNHAFSRNTARGKVIQKIFGEKQISFTPLSVRSSSLLGEQLVMLHFGDLVSFYLAGVYGIDPTPVPEIATLKKELQKL